MKTNLLIEQLEIDIEMVAARRRCPAPPCRPGRARWWFARMRQVVEQAVEWPALPPGRPEQIRLPLLRGW